MKIDLYDENGNSVNLDEIIKVWLSRYEGSNGFRDKKTLDKVNKLLRKVYQVECVAQSNGMYKSLPPPKRYCQKKNCKNGDVREEQGGHIHADGWKSIENPSGAWLEREFWVGIEKRKIIAEIYKIVKNSKGKKACLETLARLKR